MRLIKIVVIYFLIFIVLVIGTGCVVLQMEVFGNHPKGDRLDRVEKSPQYKKDHFENSIPTPMMSDDASYWKMMYRFINKPDSCEPKTGLPSVTRNLIEDPIEEPTLTWFGHSAYLIKAKGANFLMDPVFSGYASPFSWLGSKAYPGTNNYQVENLPPIDNVIISHDHYDHLDYETILKLKAQNTHFYVPLGVGAHLERWGIDTSRITELDWWETVRVNADFELTATPARHFSGRGIKRGKTLWASYVLKSADLSLYLGGDSGYGPHFKAIGDKYGPFDLAMLECGQYNTWWPNIHMMPEEVVMAAKDLKTEVLQPVHWAKFTLALHPWKDPIERVTKAALTNHIQLSTPKCGEAVLLKKEYPNDSWWSEIK